MVYDKVIEYCKKNNLSVRGFEVLCDIGNGAVGRWQDGSEPSIQTLRKMEAATKIPIAEWLS